MACSWMVSGTRGLVAMDLDSRSVTDGMQRGLWIDPPRLLQASLQNRMMLHAGDIEVGRLVSKFNGKESLTWQ